MSSRVILAWDYWMPPRLPLAQRHLWPRGTCPAQAVRSAVRGNVSATCTAWSQKGPGNGLEEVIGEPRKMSSVIETAVPEDKRQQTFGRALNDSSGGTKPRFHALRLTATTAFGSVCRRFESSNGRHFERSRFPRESRPFSLRIDPAPPPFRSPNSETPML